MCYFSHCIWIASVTVNKKLDKKSHTCDCHVGKKNDVYLNTVFDMFSPYPSARETHTEVLIYFFVPSQQHHRQPFSILSDRDALI